jgi:hypothetical protein
MKANASKTTTKIVDVKKLENALGIEWKVEKVVEGGNSALMRKYVGGMSTDETAWGWEQPNKFKGLAKGVAKKYTPLQTKKTKVGLITSRI